MANRSRPEITKFDIEFHADGVGLLAAHEAALWDARGELDQWWARRGHKPIVYYMRMDRLVKIGTTIKIRNRVHAIMPQGVLAIEDGGRPVEKSRHKQFVDHHSHGEWFWMHEALWVHLQEIRAAFEAAERRTTEAWLEYHGATCSALPVTGRRVDPKPDIGFT